MKLNEFDYEILNETIEILEKEKYPLTAKELKAIIRKLKREK